MNVGEKMAVVGVVLYSLAYWLADNQLSHHDTMVTMLTDGMNGRGGMRVHVSNIIEGCGPYVAAVDASISTELDRVLLGSIYMAGLKPYYGTRPPMFTCRNADGTEMEANTKPGAIGGVGEVYQPEPLPVVPLMSDSLED